MKFVRRLLCAAISVCLTAQLSLTAFADSISSISTSSDVPQTVCAEEQTASDEDGYDYTNNDPSYQKFINSQPSVAAFSLRTVSPVSSVYGSDTLVHQDRFSGCEKIYGIDVSYYQGDIDWEKVKAAGIEFAIIRVGYRGYGNGALVQDSKLYTYLDGAVAAGLDIGAYFFTQAINTTEAQAEAQFCIDKLKGYDLTLPVYYDIEGVDYDTGRLDSANLTQAQKTKLCEAFCDKMISAGYESGVYTNKSWFTYQVDGTALGQKYPLWLAHYTTNTDYTGNFDTWQYTGSGQVSGISTSVDMNVRYITLTPPDGTPTLSYTVTNSASAVLKWSAVSGANGYTVYRTDSTGADTAVKTLTGTSYTFDLPEGTYTYYVKAYCSQGNTKAYGSASNKVSLTRGKVYNLQATASTASAVRLVWDPVADCSGYLVYYRAPGGSFIRYQTVTDTTARISGLSASTLYDFKVTAFVNSDGSSEYKSTSTLLTASDVVSRPTNPSAVSGVKITKTTMSQVALSWNDVTCSKDGYQIALYDPVNGTYTVKTTSSVANVVVSGLSADTKYSFAVRAYYTVNGIKYYGAYSTIVSDYTLPSTPKPVIEGFYENTANISWSGSAGAAYTVYFYKDGKLVDTINTSSAAYILPDLSLGSQYSVTIQQSVTHDGNTYVSALSSPLAFTFEHSAPETVEFGSSSSSASTSIKWSKVTGATGYIIQQYNTSSKAYIKVATASASDTTKTLSNLRTNTAYTYRVISCFGTSQSAPSAAVTVYTGPSAAKTTTFTCTSTAVRINWEKVTGATGYRIYRYNDSTKTWDTVTTITNGSTLNYKQTGLSAGTTYKYKVKAYIKRNGLVYWGTASPTMTVTTKPAVATTTTFTCTSTAVRINWNKVSGATGYRIYRYNSSTGNWDIVTTIANGSTLNYKQTGLKAGTTYKYKVKSYIKLNGVVYWGAASPTFTVTTKPAVVTPTSYNSNSSAVRINWNKVSGATGYRIYRYNSSTGSWDIVTTIANGSTLTYRQAGLKSGTTYKYKVKAYIKLNGIVYWGAASPTITTKTK